MQKYYLIFILLFLSFLSQLLYAQENEPFNDFQKILPRGQIPAVINPTYVWAKDADIDDDTWVLGVLVGDQARAYSLNLLNHHEIVNDVIDSTAFAAVW